ncbi:MAG: sulfotransferase [Pseudomonadota bacterium]
MSELFALLDAKAYRKAHAMAVERLRRDGRDAEAVCALGLIALDHGNSGKALELTGKAAALAPDDALMRAQNARALTLCGRQAEARQAAEDAARIRERQRDERPRVNDIIGVVLSRVGLHERAVPFFRRTVMADPSEANPHYNLAASLQFSGDFKGAEAAYAAALQRDPDNYRAMSALASLRKQTEDDNRLDALLGAFDRLSSNNDAALHVGHAIAKTLEDLGRPVESLDWLAKAKRGKRAEVGHETAWDTALLDAAKTTYPAALPDAPLSGDGPAPLFVTGLPRTGTTLVDRILSSHSKVHSVGELNVFSDLVKKATGTQSRYVLDPETFAATRELDLSEVGQQYMAFVSSLLASIGQPGLRPVDKMPLNILNAGLIHRALPNARIVVLRRGAMDSCLSNYRQLFSTGHSYYNYSFDLEDTARYYTAFDGLVAHWRSVLPAARFMEIRYEDIVFDQEAQTRRLLDFCDLAWEERCLRFHENDAPVSTASSVQVRQPLYSGSIGRWKGYGDRVEGLRAALGSLADD